MVWLELKNNNNNNKRKKGSICDLYSVWSLGDMRKLPSGHVVRYYWWREGDNGCCLARDPHLENRDQHP